MNRSVACAAVIGGALLGLLASAACDDESDGPCADAANQADCEAVAPWEGHQCGWVTIRRFSADGACNMEDVREECVEFAGTQAGCIECGVPDKIAFVPAEGEPGEVLVTTICGPAPTGWRSCAEESESANPACECEGC